jgi:nucleotide-binding universal stress UspA family protein
MPTADVHIRQRERLFVYVRWHFPCATDHEVIPMPRNTLPPVFRCVLCPVDFSANSRSALRYAAVLARLSDADLVVLYVEDPLLAVARTTRPAARALIESAEPELRRFVMGALRGAMPAPSSTLLTRAGKPAQEIVKAAARHGCDLIVMGYRGAGRASRLLFGSTTEGVMRITTVPVVAVPPARRQARLPGASRAGLKRAS